MVESQCASVLLSRTKGDGGDRLSVEIAGSLLPILCWIDFRWARIVSISGGEKYFKMHFFFSSHLNDVQWSNPPSEPQETSFCLVPSQPCPIYAGYAN